MIDCTEKVYCWQICFSRVMLFQEGVNFPQFYPTTHSCMARDRHFQAKLVQSRVSQQHTWFWFTRMLYVTNNTKSVFWLTFSACETMQTSNQRHVTAASVAVDWVRRHVCVLTRWDNGTAADSRPASRWRSSTDRPPQNTPDNSST